MKHHHFARKNVIRVLIHVQGPGQIDASPVMIIHKLTQIRLHAIPSFRYFKGEGRAAHVNNNSCWANFSLGLGLIDISRAPLVFTGVTQCM